MSKPSTIKAIRGMNDLFPEQTQYWLRLESIFKEVMHHYGYGQIRTPQLEYSNLFKRSIGEVTDIVAKEMYTFLDRNEQSLTLRPEGTACAVRAGIEHGKFYNQTQKWWYSGAMFRYERPQKGRYRQFYQFGVEAFGFNGPQVDVEQIEMMQRFWEKLGIKDHIKLEINTLGLPESRAKYKEILINYFKEHIDLLGEQEKSRLTSNPLRILDSKNPDLKDIINNAPKLIDHLDDKSIEFFEDFKANLDAANIKYQINPHLVRGLDYYCHAVYEWVTDSLGAQGTVCAGGRYDALVSQLGGQPTPAVGFALGLERLLLLTEALDTQKNWGKDKTSKFYVIYEQDLKDSNLKQLQQTILDLREKLSEHTIICDYSGGNLNKQFKRGEKAGSDFIITIDKDNLIDNKVLLKPLYTKHPQESIKVSDIECWLKKLAN
jgi:histidyl-tRNA synthetase